MPDSIYIYFFFCKMEPCTITFPATLEVEIAGMQVAHINVTIDQLDSMLAECSLLCCKQVAYVAGCICDW